MINSTRWLKEVTVPLVAEEIEALCNTVVAGPSFQPGLGAGGNRDPQAKLCAPNCGEPHPWHGGKPKKAKLDGGNPHDVSQENRQQGKFAPGAKTAEPTGSPLDPATGVKPPPQPHEIHKQNMDYHQKAAKALQSMVKQHLDLGKLALSPEDRQNHIAQARQMKELAAKHVTEAGSHAQKMSEAMKQMVQQPAAPAGDLGITGKLPAGASPIIPKVPTPTGAQNVQAAKGVLSRQFPGKFDPNQTQTMPAVKAKPPTNTLKPVPMPKPKAGGA